MVIEPGVITTKLLWNGFGDGGSPIESGCKSEVTLTILVFIVISNIFRSTASRPPTSTPAPFTTSVWVLADISSLLLPFNYTPADAQEVAADEKAYRVEDQERLWAISEAILKEKGIVL